MNGLILALIAFMAFSVSRSELDPSNGKIGASPQLPLDPHTEAIAESIAAALPWALADITTACNGQTTGSAPLLCQTGHAPTVLTTNATLGAQTLRAYAIGDGPGIIQTYYLPNGPGQGYLIARYDAGSMYEIARYCPSVMRNLQRLTNNSRWIAPYDALNQAVHLVQTQTKAGPIPVLTIPLPGGPGITGDGCPVMVEPLTQ